MLKRTKPGLVNSNSSARLLEDVLADKDNINHLIQCSKVKPKYENPHVLLCFISKI